MGKKDRKEAPGRQGFWRSLRTGKKGRLKGKKARASLMAEASLSVPVFLFGLITMISMMDVSRRQIQELSALCCEAKQEALMAFNGTPGDVIVLERTGSFHPPAFLAPLPDIPINLKIAVRAFSGRGSAKKAERESVREEPAAMAWVTLTGHVLHKDMNCSYLSIKAAPVSGEEIENVTNKYGEPYRPCRSCSHGAPPADTVYVTEGGNTYHNQASCSHLRRTVRLVSAGEAEGFHWCSRCAAGEN